MSAMKKKHIYFPKGKMEIVSDGSHLVEVLFLYEPADYQKNQQIVFDDDAILSETEKQLKEYFQGNRKKFRLPLKIEGTLFQKDVWRILENIPYGEFLTYKEIAEQVGSPKAFRAAGGACRANHYPIIIPCHRVLGTNGSLTGFSGDKTYMKKWLLDFEKEHK